MTAKRQNRTRVTKQNKQQQQQKKGWAGVCRGRDETANITGAPVPRHDRGLGNVPMCGLVHLLGRETRQSASVGWGADKCTC